MSTQLMFWKAYKSFVRGGWKAPLFFLLLTYLGTFVLEGDPFPLFALKPGSKAFFFMPVRVVDTFFLLNGLVAMGMTWFCVQSHLVDGKLNGKLEVELTASRHERSGVLRMALQPLINLSFQWGFLFVLLSLLSGNWLLTINYFFALFLQILIVWVISSHLMLGAFSSGQAFFRLVAYGIASVLLLVLLLLVEMGDLLGFLTVYVLCPIALPTGIGMTGFADGEQLAFYWNEELTVSIGVLLTLSFMGMFWLRRRSLSLKAESRTSRKDGKSWYQKVWVGVDRWGVRYKEWLRDRFEGDLAYLMISRSKFPFNLCAFLLISALLLILLGQLSIFLCGLLVWPYLLFAPLWVPAHWIYREKASGRLDVWLATQSQWVKKIYRLALFFWLKFLLEALVALGTLGMMCFLLLEEFGPDVFTQRDFWMGVLMLALCLTFGFLLLIFVGLWIGSISTTFSKMAGGLGLYCVAQIFLVILGEGGGWFGVLFFPLQIFSHMGGEGFPLLEILWMSFAFSLHIGLFAYLLKRSWSSWYR